MQEAAVVHPDEGDEFFTEEGCHILELWRDADLTVARARVAPGGVTVRHSLAGVTERYLVAAGRGEVEVAGLEGWRAVGPGDLVAIPAGVAQRIRNTGEDDLVFYCLCTPPFTAACYENQDRA